MGERRAPPGREGLQVFGFSFPHNSDLTVRALRDFSFLGGNVPPLRMFGGWDSQLSEGQGGVAGIKVPPRLSLAKNTNSSETEAEH